MLNMYLGNISKVCNEHLILIVCLLFSAIATVISGLSIVNFVAFVAVQYFCVYIPGYAIINISGVQLESSLSRQFVSYAMGYSLSIILYLLLLIAGFQKYSIVLYSLLILISFLYLWKYKCNDSQPANLLENRRYAIVLALSFLVGVFVFQFENLSPSARDGNVILNQDMVFWFRNCVAATKGYPLPELSVMGKQFFYHYFTSIEIAWLHYMTGIEVMDLCYTYSFLTTIFLLFSGSYVVCKAVVRDDKYVLLSILFILFTSSFETITHIFYSVHIYVASFGFTEGLAISCFSFYFFYKWFDSRFANKRFLLLSAVFLMICTGLKGPVAAVLMVAYGLGCIFALLTRGAFWKGVTGGMIFLLVFILILAFFVIDTSQSAEEGSTAALSLSMTNTIFHSHYFEKLYFMFYNYMPYKSILYVFILFLYLVASMLVPLTIFAWILKRNKRIEGIDIILLCLVLSGIILTIFVSQSGMSQMYFMMVSILYLFVLSFSLAAKSPKDITLDNKYFRLAFGISFLLFAIQLRSYRGGVTREIKKVLSMGADGNTTKENGMSITYSEIEGLRWLRDNTEANIVLLSNKVLADSGSRSFWTSSLSERQTFFESYDYSNISKSKIEMNLDIIFNYFDGNSTAKNYLKKQGVTHAVIFKHIKPNGCPPNSPVLYENSDIMIAEL